MIPALEAFPVIQGYAPWDALCQLLKAFNKDTEPAFTAEDLVRGDIQDILASECERHGLLARWIHPDSSGLDSLALPSLALQEDGSFLLLLSRRHGRILAQGPNGCFPLGPRALSMDAFLDLAPCLPGRTLWRCIWNNLLHQRKALFLVLISVLMVQGVGLLTPQFMRILVDHAFPQGARSLFIIVLASSAFLGLYQAWTGWLQGRYALWLESRLTFLIEQGLVAHLLRLPYRWTRDRSIGELLQCFFGIHAAKDLLTGSVFSAIGSGVGGLAYFALMASMLPNAAIWVAGMTLLGMVLTVLAGVYLARLQARSISLQIKERSLLVEILNGITLFKAVGAERMAEHKWMKLVQSRRLLDLATQRINLSTTGIVDLLQLVFTQILTIWGGYQVLHGTLRLGEMLAFTMMAGSFQQALSQASSFYLQYTLLQPELSKVRELIEPEPDLPPSTKAELELHGPVQFENIWFQYPQANAWVFKGFSLTIQPGDKVLLGGASGCGKSTLLKLAAHLYEPGQGRITLGGSNPAEAKPKIAYLPQNVQLFSGSILENLRLFSGGASRTNLLEVAERTGLSAWAANLPMGMETIAAPGGENFSGGQRQLIALTAVIASSRPILLLDEALANLDPLSKEAILTGGLFRGKTVLLVSHEPLHGRLNLAEYGFMPFRVSATSGNGGESQSGG